MTARDLLLLALGPLAWGCVAGALIVAYALYALVRDTVRLRRAYRKLHRALRGVRGTVYPSVAAWEQARDAQPGQPHHPACRCNACCDAAQAKALLATCGMTREVRH